MIRSFEYASEIASQRAGSVTGAGRPSASALREAFVEAYTARATAMGATFLPSAPAARAAWTAFFELEKAPYEEEYEMNNRAAGAHVPIRGVLRILEGRET